LLTEPGCFCKIKIFGKTTKHHKDYTGTIFVQFKLDLRNKVYTLNSSLVFFGRWLSSGTPASSTAKTGCHEIAEILLKVALSTNKSINQSINRTVMFIPFPLIGIYWTFIM
jgi:hypothetical protein